VSFGAPGGCASGEVIAIDLDNNKLALAKEDWRCQPPHSNFSRRRLRGYYQSTSLMAGVTVPSEMAGSEKSHWNLPIRSTAGVETNSYRGGLAHPDRKSRQWQQVSLVARGCVNPERQLRGQLLPVRGRCSLRPACSGQEKLPVEQTARESATLPRWSRSSEGFEATGRFWQRPISASNSIRMINTGSNALKPHQNFSDFFAINQLEWMTRIYGPCEAM